MFADISWMKKNYIAQAYPPPPNPSYMYATDEIKQI